MKSILLVCAGMMLGYLLAYWRLGSTEPVRTDDAVQPVAGPASGNRSVAPVVDSGKETHDPAPATRAGGDVIRYASDGESGELELKHELSAMRRNYYLGDGYDAACRWAVGVEDPKYLPKFYDVEHEDVRYLFALLWHEVKALEEELEEMKAAASRRGLQGQAPQTFDGVDF